MKLPTAVFLSSPAFLVTLSLTAVLAAQQSQPARTPTSTKWFPAGPIGTQSGSVPATQTEMEPMPLVAPIFIEDGKTSSSLVIAMQEDALSWTLVRRFEH